MYKALTGTGTCIGTGSDTIQVQSTRILTDIDVEWPYGLLFIYQLWSLSLTKTEANLSNGMEAGLP